MIRNILGRDLPDRFYGKKVIPYMGIHKSTITGKRVGTNYQTNLVSSKTQRFFDSFEKLFDSIPLRDGIIISFHHALREGDNIVLPVVGALASYGIKNITLASTALFSVHTPLTEYIESGVINRIEGSMNGPIGNAVSTGDLDIPTILRSHGGRARSIQEGSLHVDIAFIAASTIDYIGNLSGIEGKNAFGSLGYPLDTDSLYADYVVGITDTILETPLKRISIPSSRIDSVLEVDSIGDPSKIATGSLGRKISANRLKIAETAVQVMWNSGFLKEGFNWQAGAGGMSIASGKFLKELMLDKNLKGGYIFGGIARNSVDLLNEGLFDIIYDAQSFDLKAVDSLRDNPDHIEVSIDHAYNPYNKGCIALNTDFSALGATEVDVDFNVNVNTFSNGLINSGIGGHQDAARSKVSMILIPLARKVPTIIDRVTTVSTPGDSIDVVVAGDCVAINPRTTSKRENLKKLLIDGGLNVQSIEELQEQSNSLASGMTPNLTEKVVTLVEYRDGTHLDVIYQIEN